MYSVKNHATGAVEAWDLAQILSYINTDRSCDWWDYDKSDWVEGWCEWCEGYEFSIVNCPEVNHYLDNNTVDPNEFRGRC